MRRAVTVMAGAILGASLGLGTAFAGPCEDAERGTYLSNVCWLIEEYTQAAGVNRFLITAADETECTVTLDRGVWIGIGRRGGQTIHFARTAPGADRIEGTRHWSSWHLHGNNLDGEGNDQVYVVGSRFGPHRIQRALDNLFLRYCRERESEF